MHCSLEPIENLEKHLVCMLFDIHTVNCVNKQTKEEQKNDGTVKEEVFDVTTAGTAPVHFL